MKIMHVDASARTQGSVSRDLSRRFIDTLRDGGVEVEIDRVDLAESPPAHFGALHTAAIYTPPEAQTEEMREAIAASDDYCARLLASDALVLGTPAYNFGPPSTLKAFLDHISRSGLTFRSDETGTTGLLGDTRVVCLTAFGGSYGQGEPFGGMDCLSPLLDTLFRFLGVTDMTQVAARPTGFAAPDDIAAAIAAAEAKVDEIAADWARLV